MPWDVCDPPGVLWCCTCLVPDRRRVATLHTGAALARPVHHVAAFAAGRQVALLAGALRPEHRWRHHRRDTDDLWTAGARPGVTVVTQATRRVCGGASQENSVTDTVREWSAKVSNPDIQSPPAAENSTEIVII